MRVFGPVPSRRLERSLGINNVVPGTCSYSCVYCQLGRTKHMQLEREHFYDIEGLKIELEQVLDDLQKKEEEIDYITLVADGEPTLDANLGRAIKLAKETGIKTAVISNSSLLSTEGLAEELAEADWVSLKCDTFREEEWRKLNRPHGMLYLKCISKGIMNFAEKFTGELATETMLISDYNDSREDAVKTAEFIKVLSPDISYVAIIPTRPPAEKDIFRPELEKVNMTVQTFKKKGVQTEYLIGYEGNKFSSTGNLETDLLNITSVHPLKEEAVAELVKKCGGSWDEVERIKEEGKIVEVGYAGNRFYLRNVEQ